MKPISYAHGSSLCFQPVVPAVFGNVTQQCILQQRRVKDLVTPMDDGVTTATMPRSAEQEPPRHLEVLTLRNPLKRLSKRHRARRCMRSQMDYASDADDVLVSGATRRPTTRRQSKRAGMWSQEVALGRSGRTSLAGDLGRGANGGQRRPSAAR
jgi:hypothetical protein